VVPGEVRHAIPVAIEVGQRTCTVSSFLMRGPRCGSAALHHLLLRRNMGTNRVRFCLDSDDDVVLLARLPVEAVTEDQLEVVLGEVLTVSEGAFEALVHLGYPGVFQPLRRGPRPGGSGATDPG